MILIKEKLVDNCLAAQGNTLRKHPSTALGRRWAAPDCPPAGASGAFAKRRPRRPCALEAVAATGGPMLQKERMEPTIRKYSSLDEMKADEYRYWQSRPAHERIDAAEEMIRDAYALKGWEMPPDVPRLQRPFVRLPCPWR
jgi:hypothetical protein